MIFRVVTIYDNGPYQEEHRTRIAVVKQLEDDANAWGVVGYFPSLTVAHRAAHDMGLQYDALEENARNTDYDGGTKRVSGPRTRGERAGGLDGPNKEVASMGNLP